VGRRFYNNKVELLFWWKKEYHSSSGRHCLPKFVLTYASSIGHFNVLESVLE
jgi:hypothetical protein